METRHTRHLMNRKTRTAWRTLGAIAATVAVALGTATAAHAESSNVSGNVNCTGSWVNYATERATTNVPIETYLRDAAGSPRGGWTTSIGIRIAKTGTIHTGIHPTADTWARIASSGIY